VIPAEDMIKKIRVAVESRRSADFLVIARTDARTTLGLDEALRRGDAFLKAGADILFIESPESEAEMETTREIFAIIQDYGKDQGFSIILERSSIIFGAAAVYLLLTVRT